MLFSLGHGQHIAVTSEANAPATRARAAGGNVSPPTEPLAAVAPGVAQMAAQSVRELVGAGQADLPERALAPTEPDGTFCYYFESSPSQPKRPDMPELLDQLAETMMTDAGDNNSSIPAIFTYIGQFIDHDITANTDRDTEISEIGGDTIEPTPRPEVRKKLGNLRDGSLALDSLYGDDTPTTPFVEKLTGLMRFPGDKAKMRLGIPDDLGGTSGRPPVPALPDNATDLPRLGFLMRRGDITQAELDALPQPLKGVFVDSNGAAIRERAIIGDGRNDENLLVAQFHTAFLRFHNKIVDAIGNVGTANKRFLRARRLTRWHYQWLIVHDYLEKLCDPDILAEVIDQEAPLYRDFFEHHPAKSPKLPMPIEFSVAAYRFGHTMIRAVYDHNRFFGNAVPPDVPILGNAPFGLLFAFTGNGRMAGEAANSTGQLPARWVIEWNRFIEVDTPFHSARRIDTHLAPPLRDMVNEGGQNPGDLVRHLARRNLRRGYKLNLPTGQACLAAVEQFRGAPLPAVDLALDEIEALVPGAGFAEHTPLWYFILREGEKSSGDHLGPLGSYLVANTLIGLLVADRHSYWQSGEGEDRWEPAEFRPSDPIDSFAKMLKFAGMLA
jgi:Animal haem peroxidase